MNLLLKLALLGAGGYVVMKALEGPACCWTNVSEGGLVVRKPVPCGGHPCGTQLYG